MLYYQSFFNNTFNSFLKAGKVSEKTKINYKSDIKHFFGWMMVHVNITDINSIPLKTILIKLTPQAIHNYINWQKENSTPMSTINRRLSSIRMFIKCAKAHGLISSNPMKNITNLKSTHKKQVTIGTLLNDFGKHLESEGASKSTIRHYLADVKHLLERLTAQSQKKI